MERDLRRVGAAPIIFDQIPKPGAPTIIELLERHVPSADAIVALLTPDDEGREKDKSELQPRARQNVLIEAGYGVISRRDSSIFVTLGGVEVPTDFQGIHVIKGPEWTSQISWEVIQRLAETGLPINTTDFRV